LGENASTLQAFRVEAEERATILDNVVTECNEEMQRSGEQLKTVTSAMGSELEAVKEERANVGSRADDLRKQKEELLEKLRQVDEELAAAEHRCEELDVRSEHLSCSMGRVSDELSQQMDATKEHGVLAAKRQEVLQGALKTSRVIEDQLRERATAAEEALCKCEMLTGQHQLVNTNFLQSDRIRCHELHELLTEWHDLVWGPEASVLARQPDSASALRAGHLRAAACVDEAVREVEEIIADKGLPELTALEGLLGITSAGSEEEQRYRQMCSAMQQYRDMRDQLNENLERLAELDVCVSVNMKAPTLLETSMPTLLEAEYPDGLWTRAPLSPETKEGI